MSDTESNGKKARPRRPANCRVSPLVALAALSPRQREILHWIVQGETYPAIAIRLGISKRTVETHAAAVILRLGQRNRHEVARFYYTNFLDRHRPPVA